MAEWIRHPLSAKASFGNRSSRVKRGMTDEGEGGLLPYFHSTGTGATSSAKFEFKSIWFCGIG